MLENKEQKGEVTFGNVPKVDYYANGNEKIVDFCLGFFGIIAIYIFLIVAYGWSNLPVPSFFIGLVMIVLMAVFFGIKRKFIAIGILASLLIPVLIFGSCLFGLGGFRFF